jgi:TPP-dependent pyruvate/acetoin dehydrogenase alpha subunit
MPPDLWSLYALMFKSRLFEQTVTQFWNDGLISGEMHLGTGEEAIVAGIVGQLSEGDAICLDHRGTPPLIMRGIDPVLILHELLGRPDGLCGGKGGHMHLFSKDHLVASSGIVGAAGPAAAGFALAAHYLRPKTVAVAFFGDGAINQGMLMESMNLAAAWNLPVLFVCKDDGWAITTTSRTVTAGDLSERARGLGLEAVETDGRDVSQVWETAHRALERIRSGKGAVFLRAQCVHLEGHFLGYQLLRATREPLKELPGITIPLAQSLVHSGGGTLGERLAGLRIVIGSLLTMLRDPRVDSSNDPVKRTRSILKSDPSRLHELERAIEREIDNIAESALQEVAP